MDLRSYLEDTVTDLGVDLDSDLADRTVAAMAIATEVMRRPIFEVVREDDLALLRFVALVFVGATQADASTFEEFDARTAIGVMADEFDDAFEQAKSLLDELASDLAEEEEE